MRADGPEVEGLKAAGWRIVARSFGAQLDLEQVDRAALDALVNAAASTADDRLRIRELGPDDVESVLALDLATTDDYPGGVATQHEPLDRVAATPSSARRAFGAVEDGWRVVAMTFVEVDAAVGAAETDFTVVDAARRRRGLAMAVKAASVLALAADGVARLRTGGSADNEAIIRVGEALGYVRDEEWITLGLSD